MMWPIIWTYKKQFQPSHKPPPKPQSLKPTTEHPFITIEDVYRLLII